MVDFRPQVIHRFFCAITLFGFVGCQLSACAGGSVYYLDGVCSYLCPAPTVINGNLLCKSDQHTVVPCSEDSQMDNLRKEDCTKLRCEVMSRNSLCPDLPSPIFPDVRFIRSNVPRENVTHSPIYIYPDNNNKPNLRPTHEEMPRITFEEPSSQMYMYGILSFFFGVIAFFIFALVFRFLYKRYQRHPVHVHTFSGHQLPLGSLQLRSFLSPSPYPPQLPFPRNEQVGIPGLDLPPSYVVASELLDPPPSYEDISKPKRHSAQMKITSL